MDALCFATHGAKRFINWTREVRHFSRKVLGGAVESVVVIASRASVSLVHHTFLLVDDVC